VDECKTLQPGRHVLQEGGRGARGQRGARARHGRAVQLDPIKPPLKPIKPPVSKSLILKYGHLLSIFAFKFNLRRYSMALAREVPESESFQAVPVHERDKQRQTRFRNAAAMFLKVGLGGYRSPRHRVPFHAGDEGSNCVG